MRTAPPPSPASASASGSPQRLTDLHETEARPLRRLLERVAQTARREAITPDDVC
ncbi:hypothetical protein [Streptomyces lacrimifluminis]|uniref:hypothetical protein n=1 Tax=Streptomyces lacrimifluminis TaxID=1500077 RepID=UPI001664E206|nr:hypothetical protein [Streptomyces lacrimifluminis]